MLNTVEIQTIEDKLRSMSSEELLELELDVMALIMLRKQTEGKIVFWEADDCLMN